MAERRAARQRAKPEPVRLAPAGIAGLVSAREQAVATRDSQTLAVVTE